MATFRINFTKAALERVLPPKLISEQPRKGSIYDTYYDTREKGLVLLVTNSGAKTFYLYAKIDARPERIKLGAFSDLSIEQARKKAAQRRGEIANGENPQQVKRSFRQEATLGELFVEYLERYSKKQKKSWRYDEREINKFLPHWFHRKISSITSAEIQKLHERVHDENGLYQANRLLERIRAMYNKAIEWGWNGTNPAAGIRKFKEKARDRFLLPKELPYFFQALAAEQNLAAKDYIALSLLTGARKSNMLSMRWEEVNLSQAQWRIPESKNGEPVVVALSGPAMEVLARRRKVSSSPWVFHSESSRTGHLQDPKKPWQRLLIRAELYELIDMISGKQNWGSSKVASARTSIENGLTNHLQSYRNLAAKLKLDTSGIGLPGIRIHDLRRTMGSWQAVTGASGYIIGKSLGHKSQQATAIYARLNLDPVRDSVEKATRAILSAGGLL